MVQLYLLCLVREGKIRLTLSGRNVPVDVIDYGNIAGIGFRAAVLEAFDQVQRLRPPEGWEVLAPFAAALLQDDDLQLARQDADIQAAVQRLMTFKSESLKPFQGLRTGLTALFAEVGRVETLEERLEAWEAFLASPVDAAEPIPFLRNALHKAFGYPVYPDDTVRQADVDDLAARQAEVGQAQAFYQHRDRVRAAARYAHFELPDEPALASIRKAFEKGRSCLGHLEELIANEARLLSEFLEPMEEAIGSYNVRYLQVYDQVTAHAEQVRMQVEALSSGAAYRVLGRLARVKQLGVDLRPQVQRAVRHVLDEPSSLFPTTLSRAEVKRLLREWPQPPQCALTLDNAKEWIQRADDAMASCRGTLDAAFLDRATLLHSDALRERLAQGCDEPFIAGLLKAEAVEDTAKYLIQTLGGETLGEPDPVDLLIKYLKKLNVRKLRLADFSPSKRTVEPSDLDQIVGEFRDYLSDALEAGEDELSVVELE